MHAVDRGTQPIEGQRRQPCHAQDAQPNLRRPTALTTFLMSDTQAAFPFSIQSASPLQDGSMAALPSSSPPGQDAGFFPIPSSSPVHPSSSNVFVQPQSFNISPTLYYGAGQIISPAQSNGHLTPEARHLGDSAFQDSHRFVASTYNNHVLDHFSSLGFADSDLPTAFPALQGTVDMSFLTSGAINTYNAQPSTLASDAASLEVNRQLLSPCMTAESSPVIGDSSSMYSTMHFSTTNQHSSSVKQMQSPALTNSSGQTPLPNGTAPGRHLNSPIVRVESCSRDNSPSRSDNSRPVSKQSYGSRHPVNYLSPFPRNSSSEDGKDILDGRHIQTAVQVTERREDGSWLTRGGSNQAGLSPGDRQVMGDVWVPSIEELAEQRSRHEKKLEVEEWLTKSEVGSETGRDPSDRLLKPVAGRRRAKSTNDVHHQKIQGQFSLGIRTEFDQAGDDGVPRLDKYIHQQADYEEHDDNDDSNDDSGDDYTKPESPPAAIDVQASHADNSYFPMASHSIAHLGAMVRPWADAPSQQSDSLARYQPPTSNAAMMRFRLRANDIESASLTATIGSRRMSESDIGSIRAPPAIARPIGSELKKNKERQRRPSFLDNILLKRAPNNLLKRKGSIPVPQPLDGGSDKPKESIAEKPKRISSWGRPKSPRTDVSLSSHNRDGGPITSAGVSASSGPWYQGAKNVIRRSRSRSDIGRSFGLAELMTQHGGPPMPMLASPLGDTEATRVSGQPSPAGEDDEEEHEAVIADFRVQNDAITPSYDGFRTHARQLNPRLADFMIERITQEQMRRYKRLLDFRVKHLNAVKSRDCTSGEFCPHLGGAAKHPPPRPGNKDTDAPFIGFHISVPGARENDAEPPLEGTVISAQFPLGVPLPPVQRLPAEFECPLCFKVKKFSKPSDWTKHVHEDVQPFTCTFPHCGEPKSFKRKADWVRHENERHRQLENWTCQIADCNHVCYRKDNFVQHLVREHKIAEPRQRVGRGHSKDVVASGEQGDFPCPAIRPDTYVLADDIWTMVEQCRSDTAKQPKDEPCRFCGVICSSWKKLTVHLAKHMEQLSMPILLLVEQKPLNADSIISPLAEVAESGSLSTAANMPSADQIPQYDLKSSLTTSIDPAASYPHNELSESVSNAMHSCLPTQTVMYQDSQAAEADTYTNFTTSNDLTYSSEMYPGSQKSHESLSGYTSGLEGPDQPYHNANMPNNASPYSSSAASIGLQPQSLYGDSFGNSATFTSHHAQKPQNLTGGPSDTGYDTISHMQPQQQSAYPATSYVTTQHTYQYS